MFELNFLQHIYVLSLRSHPHCRFDTQKIIFHVQTTLPRGLVQFNCRVDVDLVAQLNKCLST